MTTFYGWMLAGLRAALAELLVFGFSVGQKSDQQYVAAFFGLLGLCLGVWLFLSYSLGWKPRFVGAVLIWFSSGLILGSLVGKREFVVYAVLFLALFAVINLSTVGIIVALRLPKIRPWWRPAAAAPLLLFAWPMMQEGVGALVLVIVVAAVNGYWLRRWEFIYGEHHRPGELEHRVVDMCAIMVADFLRLLERLEEKLREPVWPWRWS